MIFAAGLGTRLRPLTGTRPKALVEVGGASMLERVARRLVAAGADRLVINTHPFPDQVRAAVAAARGWGADVRFSHEAERPLETGGGLRHAAPLFRGDRTILLHNVDVLSDLPLGDLAREHERCGALATLAVNQRAASRYLIFDDGGLVGHVDTRSASETFARPPRGVARRLAFCGVHAVAPELPGLIDAAETDASIIVTYLRLSAAGRVILPFRIDAWQWLDIGSADRLRDADAAVAANPRL